MSSYRDAIGFLNSLQSNAAVLEVLRSSGGYANKFAIPEMIEYLNLIGYTPQDLNALNVIHITGTKGKGSTSAFTSSILCHAKPHWKIGLYTSPHLVAVRERIRINGVPLSEEEFTKYFFEVWNRLKENDHRRLENTPSMPSYFRFLTLMAFHTFLSKKVDATILEVGVGGTYDSTNIVPKPIVTGVTALGIDHVTVLGKTIKEIAWHKGGIYKEGVPAFTAEQPLEGLEVLKQQATDLKASSFTVVPSSQHLANLKLGLSGVHQIQNASLAVQLAKCFLQLSSASEDLPGTFLNGLQNTRWSGRCQVVVDPILDWTTWYLDGAHTLESLECCMQWFVSPSIGVPAKGLAHEHLPLHLLTFQREEAQRVLIFNCTQGRSGASFIQLLHETALKKLKQLGEKDMDESFFHHVIFCTNVTYADGQSKPDLLAASTTETEIKELTIQRQLALAWSSLLPSFPISNIHVMPNIESAVKVVQTIDSGSEVPIKVLVTGSLRLVGGLIEAAKLTEVAL
ncbi:hypothetical protein AMATHDRAFT_139326 [Amanita thiersii Skay4041]|uniref:Folylpolyglutamate synthase n=1 Tax=Amanita thiersii Skay4041 TaxID=703135 RepID=A0A2A9NWW8_9AGAR|nr:hypothetical protein AMATHDRAFT_139326 [Amanita thiersii Skay4041]